MLGANRIEIRCEQRDIADLSPFPIGAVDIVITDLPYGNIARWGGAVVDPLPRFFKNCKRALDRTRSVLVITADKKTKLKNELFQRVQHFKLGKRQTVFFVPREGA